MVLPLAMGWRNLLFENYPVDPDLLAAHLPDALDVDTFEGDAWLSVVPFTNVDVRPEGLPAALGVDLPELNLRTYVEKDGQRGVYFFSLDAQGVASVLGARAFHNLPYYYARISLAETDDGDGVHFESRRQHPGDRPAHYVADYGPDGAAFEPEPGTLPAFLVERYRFYTQGRDGTVRYTDVDHPPWTLRPAWADVTRNTLLEANGFATPDAEPTLYYSDGLDVTASTNRRWEAIER